ncbi:hypothetical protein ACFXKW_08375 [Streptomyces sp. NPDC059193]|uniref:hypothetical protein n=1 Tax=Streptomyces sp. NPDC059193 TaxID=3346763 RepID=UPI003686AB8A
MTDLAEAHGTRARRALDLLRTEGPAAARIVVTVAAAWQVALWLGARQPPVFAAIVPLVALRGDPMTALGTAVQRALGVVVTILLAPLLWPPDPHRILASLADDSRRRLVRALTATAAALGSGPAAARDNLAQVDADVEAVHAHAARAREAERAMRFNPLRRRHRDTVRLRARLVATADRLTPHLTALAREVAELSGREDLAPDLARARARLPELAALTVRAVEHTLSGEGPRPAAAAARAYLAEYARTDDRPLAVTLRRPLHQLLDDLDGLDGPAAPSAR